MHLATDPYGHDSTTEQSPSGGPDPVAIASVVLGAGAFVTMCCCSPISFLMCMASIATGAITISQGNPASKPLGIAGIVMGALAILVNIGLMVMGVGMQVLTALFQ